MFKREFHERLISRFLELAQQGRWKGNVYNLARVAASLCRELDRLNVSCEAYLRSIESMMKNGVDEERVLRYIGDTLKKVENIRRKLDELGVQSTHLYERIEEVEAELALLQAQAEKTSLEVLEKGCKVFKGEGVLTLALRNPGSLPIEVRILSVEGGTLLIPPPKMTIESESSHYLELPLFGARREIKVRLSYRVRGGNPQEEVIVVPVHEKGVSIGPEILLNKPIEALKALGPLEYNLRKTALVKVGDYLMKAYLGGGGFYYVFLAERENNKVAIKIPKPFCSPDLDFYPIKGEMLEENIKLVESEAETLQRVKRIREKGFHHLIDYYEHGVAEVRANRLFQIPYIALQYCPKGSLARVTRASSARLSERDALTVLLQVGLTLMECYKAGVFQKHGDLKPENLLVDGEGRVVITDFQTALRERRTQEIGLGTPGFYHSAPDDRADVYALGKILVELVYGEEAPESSVVGELEPLVRISRREDPVSMESFLKLTSKVAQRLGVLPLF